ncbi:MAG: GTPase HflX [Planctomycetota bacterium]|nr:GTPase HflX [Planctomycetota bacterium]
MQDTQRQSESVHAERAVLVGLLLPGREYTGTRYDPLSELKGLATAAGAEVVGRVIQKRNRPAPGTYIGRGKVAELAEYVEDKSADVVVFDNELTPPQIREIEKLVRRKVLDRTELILDIFASRAQTHAARLQVELAQLEYTAPRLRGMWTHLERIAGAGGGTTAGAVGGIGTRGPGERQIEIDRRIVQKRVTLLKEQLAKIDRRKLREVRARSDYFTIGLVGYTNAGKSTLLNALTGAEEMVADKLFATLDTKTRRWNLGEGRAALLSDTVGFVRDLPHNLVASFRATLEEAIHSNLLLHVVDAASHNASSQIRAVESVLAELGCQETPTILVLNKIDSITDSSDIHLLRTRRQDAIEVSARTARGLDELRERVIQRIEERYVRVIVDADPANGKLLAYVSQHGQICAREYPDGRMRLELRLPPAEVPRLVDLGGRVIEHAQRPRPARAG